MSQILVSMTEDYKEFEYVEVSEGETAQLCVIVRGPLTETLYIMIETTDSGQAVGECMCVFVCV